MNKSLIFTFTLLSCFGLVTIGTMIHEGIHWFQADNPQSICLDFGKSTIASVTAHDFQANTEFWAYGMQTLFLIITCSLVMFKGRQEFRK